MSMEKILQAQPALLCSERICFAFMSNDSIYDS